MTKFRIMAFAVLAVPGVALAGPCSDEIAAVGKTLAYSPSLGPVTTGTLTGAGPGSTPGSAPGIKAGEAPGTAGTSADNRVGGTAGTKELNAASGAMVATSADDVRRQQEGLPTAAAQAAKGGGSSVETTPGQPSSMPNDRMSQAKTALERARTLDAAGDGSCKDAVERAKSLAG